MIHRLSSYLVAGDESIYLIYIRGNTRRLTNKRKPTFIRGTRHVSVFGVVPNPRQSSLYFVMYMIVVSVAKNCYLGKREEIFRPRLLFFFFFFAFFVLSFPLERIGARNSKFRRGISFCAENGYGWMDRCSLPAGNYANRVSITG